jgi:hypothetical protein
VTSPRATVREVDGRLVLDDPDGLAVLRAVSKHNCAATLEAHAERVPHLVGRIASRGLAPSDVVIVVIAVDDLHGRELAEALMPGTDWSAFRERGEAPYARGLAERAGITDALATFDAEAADKLRSHAGIAVVVVDHGVAEVFHAPGGGP